MTTKTLPDADGVYTLPEAPVFEVGTAVTYKTQGLYTHRAYVVHQDGDYCLLSTSHPDVATGVRHWLAAFLLTPA